MPACPSVRAVLACSMVAAVGTLLVGCSATSPSAPPTKAPARTAAASSAPTGVTTQEPTTAPTTPDASQIHGLLVLSGYSRLSSEAELDVIGLPDGDNAYSASFPISDGIIIDGPSFGTVSPGLNYLAARHAEDDGTEHGGFINSDGAFTDVSAPLAQSGSFAGGLNTDRVAFIGDRLYLNLRSTSNNASDTVYSIPVTTVASGSFGESDFRKETIASPMDPNARPKFAPDGTVTKKTNGCQSAYGKWAYEPSAFLGRDSYVVLHDNTLQKLPLDRVCGIGFQGSKNLLPSSDQTVTQVTVSPTKDQIAFLAVRGQQASYYTVPANGGDPKLLRSADGTASALVAWR